MICHYKFCGYIPDFGKVAEIARRHKQEMTEIIASLLPPSRHRKQDAQALALAVDGAIIHAQFDLTPDAALSSLKKIQQSLADKN